MVLSIYSSRQSDDVMSIPNFSPWKLAKKELFLSLLKNVYHIQIYCKKKIGF